MVRCQLVAFCLVAVGVTLGADVNVQSLDTADLVPLQQVKSLHIKEWTIDFQNELDSGFRSAVAADQLATLDFEKFIYDIIVDDGHDEESSLDGTVVDLRSCDCCQKMSRQHNGSAGDPSPHYNALVDTVLQRVTQQVGPYQLDPMPLRLRRRSVRETAYLFQTMRNAKQLRNGVGTGAPMRMRGTLTGFGTLRRSGDVKADLLLPHGRTLLKVDVHAGPVHLNIPRDTRSVTQVSMDDLNGEMVLMLHPRQGVLLHSLSFEKPALVSRSTWRSAAGEQFDTPAGAKRLAGVPLGGSTEGAVAHQLRATMRHLMRNAR